MSIDPNATYTVLGSDLQNAITQAGYVNTALIAEENAHPSLLLTALHRQMNAMALISANAIKDPDGNPLPSNTFGGNGTLSGTSPQSGGTPKGP